MKRLKEMETEPFLRHIAVLCAHNLILLFVLAAQFRFSKGNKQTIKRYRRETCAFTTFESESSCPRRIMFSV